MSGLAAALWGSKLTGSVMLIWRSTPPVTGEPGAAGDGTSLPAAVGVACRVGVAVGGSSEEHDIARTAAAMAIAAIR